MYGDGAGQSPCATCIQFMEGNTTPNDTVQDQKQFNARVYDPNCPHQIHLGMNNYLLGKFLY